MFLSFFVVVVKPGLFLGKTLHHMAAVLLDQVPNL